MTRSIKGVFWVACFVLIVGRLMGVEDQALIGATIVAVLGYLLVEF